MYDSLFETLMYESLFERSLEQTVIHLSVYTTRSPSISLSNSIQRKEPCIRKKAYKRDYILQKRPVILRYFSIYTTTSPSISLSN